MLHMNNQDKHKISTGWEIAPLQSGNSKIQLQYPGFNIFISQYVDFALNVKICTWSTTLLNTLPADKKVELGFSYSSLSLWHTNAIPLNTNSFNWSPSRPAEPPEMWPENWISLRLLFPPLCAGTSRDNKKKIEPRRTTETQRGSEIWVSSWMLGFLFSEAWFIQRRWSLQRRAALISLCSGIHSSVL